MHNYALIFMSPRSFLKPTYHSQASTHAGKNALVRLKHIYCVMMLFAFHSVMIEHAGLMLQLTLNIYCKETRVFLSIVNLGFPAWMSTAKLLLLLTKVRPISKGFTKVVGLRFEV